MVRGGDNAESAVLWGEDLIVVEERSSSVTWLAVEVELERVDGTVGVTAAGTPIVVMASEPPTSTTVYSSVEQLLECL